MTLSETLSETSICNMALRAIGMSGIDSVEDDTSVEAIRCRLYYEQTRDALLRSHSWRFAAEREELSTGDTPDFEWDFSFPLPDDFLAMRSIYENRFSGENFRSYALEGQILLTNEDEMKIRYTKKVTDVTEFDPLFVEVLILQLALKLTSLAGATPKIRESIKDDLEEMMSAVRALDGQETNTAGRAESGTWNDARQGGRDPARL